MAILSSLVDPRVFPTLTEKDIAVLTAVIDGEVARNPEIHKILRERIDAFDVGKASASRAKPRARKSG